MSFEVPRSFSRRVFDDGHEAIYDRRHPCHHMIRWQDELGIKPYQLPEPFSGRRSEYRLIFVGLNPSVSENEEIPVAADDWDLKRYDDYYRARFDPAHRNSDGRIAVRFLDNSKPKVPKLWRNIEDFGRKHISKSESDAFVLGQHAILLEIVHYKSKGGWLGNTLSEKTSLLEHELNFTGTLLDEIAPCVLVAMGTPVLRQLNRLLDLSLGPEPQVTKLMGKALTGRTPSGARVLVAAIQHLSYPTKRDAQQAVARAICKAIEAIS